MARKEVPTAPAAPENKPATPPATTSSPAPVAGPKSTVKPSTATDNEIGLVVRAEHWDPFTVLGLHETAVDGKKCLVVRAFLSEAERAWVVEKAGDAAPKKTEMVKVHPDGFYECVFADRVQRFPYRLEVINHEGHSWQFEDPYRFGPVLTDFDLHLLGEGTHYKNYERLGAHLREHEGVRGVNFAVWAPNAERVSVVGNFNHWDGRRHPLRNRGPSGIWEIFIPEISQGEVYKYEIKSRYNDYLVEKADPYGFYAEHRPRTASIVWDVCGFEWNDEQWMADRVKRQALDAPIAIYEVHLGSWKRKSEEGNRFLTYRELADELVVYLADTGFTHIELMPVSEHPFDGSWGYQPVGYFAPTSRFGNPDDFAYFVDKLHQHGFGIILDWVPAHFPRDVHGLGFFDGTHLYEHSDPRLGEHRDWGTKIFNYGRPEVRNFLMGNALFWLERYHIDGIRVDAVASMLYLDYSREAGEWVPNIHGGNENLEAIDFLKQLNIITHQEHPGILTTAEESTSFGGVSRPVYLGGLGFSLKWNMGWMNDTLRYMSKEPIHRKYEHGSLTFSMIYAFTENFLLPLSHDEVVHGKGSLLDKMPGDLWQKFANLRLLYGYMYGHPGKKLLFMGDEIAPWTEWNHDQSLDWHLLQWESHRGTQRLVTDLNRLYKSEPALHQIDFEWQGFDWLDLHDWENSVIAFVRNGRSPSEKMVVVCNFTPVPREDYRIGVPVGGFYQEMLNTDSEIYSGSNLGNSGGVWAVAEPLAGKPFHLSLRLPPLGVLFLKPIGPGLAAKS